MSTMRIFEFRNKICDSSYIYVIYVYVYIYIYIFVTAHFTCFITFCSHGNSTFRVVQSTREKGKVAQDDADIRFFPFSSFSVGHRAMIHNFHSRFIHNYTIVTFIVHIYKSVLVLFSLSTKVSVRVK